MAKKLYEEQNIYDIACAIREKCGGSDTYRTCDMAEAIRNLSTGGGGGGGDISDDKLIFSGRNKYTFYDGKWDWFLEEYGNRITTQGLGDCDYMFWASNVENIPFDFNFASGREVSCAAMFENCDARSIGTIKNLTTSDMSSMFSECFYLRELPTFESLTYNRSCNGNIGIFQLCKSLRTIPTSLLNSFAYSYSYLFSDCYALDEIIGLGVDLEEEVYGDEFYDAFTRCSRIKDLIFDTQGNGTPYSVKWDSQSIRLDYYVGYYQGVQTDMTGYNSGITDDKEVTNNATYQALKNNPDWWTKDINYSRYNRISAVNTINSLPDTSAFIAETGGINNISFKGAAGALTDGGAINAMTEEEIAVATAKGWTVSFV